MAKCEYNLVFCLKLIAHTMNIVVCQSVSLCDIHAARSTIAVICIGGMRKSVVVVRLSSESALVYICRGFYQLSMSQPSLCKLCVSMVYHTAFIAPHITHNFS